MCSTPWMVMVSVSSVSSSSFSSSPSFFTLPSDPPTLPSFRRSHQRCRDFESQPGVESLTSGGHFQSSPHGGTASGMGDSFRAQPSLVSTSGGRLRLLSSALFGAAAFFGVASYRSIVGIGIGASRRGKRDRRGKPPSNGSPMFEETLRSSRIRLN